MVGRKGYRTSSWVKKSSSDWYPPLGVRLWLELLVCFTLALGIIMDMESWPLGRPWWLLPAWLLPTPPVFCQEPLRGSLCPLALGWRYEPVLLLGGFWMPGRGIMWLGCLCKLKIKCLYRWFINKLLSKNLQVAKYRTFVANCSQKTKKNHNNIL